MKCLCFDCYAGFDPVMAAGALLDISGDTECARRICKDGGFELKTVLRAGMEAALLDISRTSELGFVTRDELVARANSFDTGDKVKKSLCSMIQKLAEAIAINPEEAQFELSDIMPHLAASAIVFEQAEAMGAEAVYSSAVFSSGESGLFGSFTSIETLWLCNKYKIDTRSSQVRAELFPPVGAALMAQLGAVTGSYTLRIIKCGYGAGAADCEEVPNVLRAVLGEDGEKDFISFEAEHFAADGILV